MRLKAAFTRINTARVVIPARALANIFDECDNYAVDETGGRLIGTYTEADGRLLIKVSGVIEAGPSAQRSSTSFFQDGEFQEQVFRGVERDHPNIEHVGNWHTHHVNGFPHLSEGDIATYTRIVNHHRHNTTFFYALLVTAKESSRSRHRYSARHYLLRRGDAKVYEIDPRRVEITDEPLLWPTATAQSASLGTPAPMTSPADVLNQRAHDGAVLRDFYRRLRPFTSPKALLYWKGPIELVDGSEADVMVIEDASKAAPTYALGLSDPRNDLKALAEELGRLRFPSARAALIHAERACNRALFDAANSVATFKETTWTS